MAESKDSEEHELTLNLKENDMSTRQKLLLLLLFMVLCSTRLFAAQRIVVFEYFTSGT